MSKKLPRGQIIELGGEPRINFLPGEIQERKDARRRRRSLFMLVILVGVLCGIGYFYAAQYATERQAALESEQQATLDILAQQAQFMDAKHLAAQVQIVGKGIAHVTQNEARWRELVVALRDELPPGATLRQWSFTGPTSQEVAKLSDDIFEVQIGGVITLDLVVDRVGTIGNAIDRLAALPGVMVVNVQSTSKLEDEPGYGTVLSVFVSTEVYENRFAEGWQPGMTPIPGGTPTPAPDPDTDTGVDTPDDSDADSEGGEDQ